MAGGEGSLSRGPAKTAAAATTATAGAGEQKHRLSNADVRWLLALKPMEPPASLAALKRSSPDLTPLPEEEADEDRMRLYRLTKAFFEMEERLPGTQEWVRGELKNKGFVELDDESARRRAEVQALIDREWPEIEDMMRSLVLSENEYCGEGGDDDESDYDESDSDESGSEEDEVQYSL